MPRDSKGWLVMKRLSFVALLAAALLVPSFASAEGARYVYRPELRQWIVIPPAAQGTAAPLSAEDRLARHEAMARGQQGTRMMQGSTHCDRMMQQAREELHQHGTQQQPQQEQEQHNH